MPSFLSNFGLRATASPVPNYAATFLIANFASAYLALSARTIKQIYGLDHNGSPREDVAKYGAQMVKDGKISQATLDMIKRWEAANANAQENYSLFATAVLLSLVAGVPAAVMNSLMLGYTLARAVYGVVYIRVASDLWSQIRGICWWTGNLCCLVMMGMAGKRLQG